MSLLSETPTHHPLHQAVALHSERQCRALGETSDTEVDVRCVGEGERHEVGHAERRRDSKIIPQTCSWPFPKPRRRVRLHDKTDIADQLGDRFCDLAGLAVSWLAERGDPP